MEMKKLDARALKLWYIRSGIVALVLLAAYIPAAILIPASAVKTAALVPSGVILFITLSLLFVLPYFRYALYRYGFDEKRIVVCHGVIFRHRAVIPVCQIQDLHRFEGPIMMLLSISGVTISTAGSNFDLACLSKADADAMIEALEKNLERRVEELKNEEIQ